MDTLLKRNRFVIHKRTAIALLFGCSIIGGLLLADGVARLLPERLFEQTGNPKGDPLLGSPVQNVDVSNDFPEDPKPADVYRIVVLGDSHTVSVKNELSFPEVLERLLNNDHAAGRKRVEVYNGGGLGHSPYQYYLYLKSRLTKYQPDLVVVALHIGNDFLDLYRNDDRPSLWFDGREFVHKDPEFFKFDDPNRTGIFRSSRVLHLAQSLFRDSVGYQWSRVRVLWTVGRQSGEGVGAAANYLYTITRGYFVNQHIFRQSMNQILFLKRFPRVQADLDRANRRTIELTKAVAQENGMRLLYVPIVTKLQVEPESDRVVIDKTLALCGFDRSALKLEDDLTESLISLLDGYQLDSLRVRDALVEGARKGVLYDETYHINEQAHAIIGRALYQKVNPMLTQPSPR